MATRDTHTLDDISKWTHTFACIPQRLKSCDSLCRAFEDQVNVSNLLDGKPVTIFCGYTMQLTDWSLRGCPFARLLTRWFRQSMWNDHINISLYRVSHPNGIPAGLHLVRLSAGLHDRSISLEMVTDQYDPARALLVGQPVSPNPLSSQNLAIVSRWLNWCMTQAKGHERCPKWKPTMAKLPTRVISVLPSSGRPRLYISEKDEVGQYMALSYCWGGPQPHRTRTVNLAQYTQELPTQQLPATIIDAIRLAQAFSIPYLWIDSLCIVQDSDEDKIREIATMDQVYKNSCFTISAARAHTCLDGFLGIQEATAERLSKSVTIPIVCPDGSLGNATLYPVRFDKGNSNVKIPVNSRAWTYQETLISPRTISYYHDHIEFKCTAGLQGSDNLGSLEQPSTNVLIPRSSTLAPYFYLEPVPNETLSPAPCPQDLQKWWRQIVYDYSTGELSNPDDKLPALSAIAAEFHRVSGGVSGTEDTYLAGLWRRSLIRDLMWARSEPEWRTPNGSTTPSARRHHIPTWSWASVDGHISYFGLGCNTVASPRIEILDCTVSPASTPVAMPFGCVNGGRLVLRGPVRRITCKEAWALFGPENVLPLTVNRKVGTFMYDYRWGKQPSPAGKADRQSGGAEDRSCTWGIPCNRGSLWLLGLAMKPGDRYETFGMVLVESAEGGRYRRGMLRNCGPLRFLSFPMRSDGGSGGGKGTGSSSENRGYCERAGIFGISNEYFAAAGPLRAEMRRFLDNWGKEYEMRTVTIC